MITVYTFVSPDYTTNIKDYYIEVCAENLDDAKKRYKELTGKPLSDWGLIKIQQRMGQSDLVKALKDFLE